ncbi:membrane protein [Roseibium alexandrii]|uniref:Putative membrane protein n=1 Tax=Roseibium alexandrii (strain DSM 17067 / NCIMB 14079 / DFL-11) TaxID=244592 RepID=A0A5E8H1Q2_ROSAD|nr:membrane protein [Roseibium alexandrii]EEE45744.2 putative membrane protein [Roseibium alexandrii DFL-11]
MDWSISFDPLVPQWVLITAGAIAAVVAVLLGIINLRGWVLRALAMALLVLALANPAVEREDRETLSSVVALVVDKSQSQRLADREETTTAAAEEIQSRIAELEGFDLRLLEARNSGAGDGTEVFQTLANGLADVPPERVGGAIIITDGQIHDIPENAEALGFDAPVHGLITGTADERDRRIVLDTAPRFGLVGSEQTISLTVVDQGLGTGPGDQVNLTIKRDGDVVTLRTARTGEKIDIPVEIAHGGDNIFEIEAEVLPGELTTLNNRAVVTVDGIRENLRVLLVSGSPHAGERTWRNLLKSDASVDLVHFTILRPPEKQDGTPINQLSLIAFPTRELFSVKIDEFDLIIFDRYVRRGVLPMLYFDNITQYVREGGAVLLAGGPDYAEGGSLYRTPLAPILPARPTGAILEEPFYATLANLGERHPVTRGLPGAEQDPPAWSRWFRAVDTELDGGQTLMSGPSETPLLVLNREGEGRVAMLLSDHVWLWARGFEGGGPHVPLLRRLAHWLMQEPDLEEEALNVSLRGPELIVERQTLGETVNEVTVVSPTGDNLDLTMTEQEPGLWRGSSPVTETGLFSVTDGEMNALIHVGPQNPREYTNVLSDTDVLSPVSEATGGAVQRLRDVGGSLDLPRVISMRQSASYEGNGWIGLKQTEASLLNGVDRFPLLIGLLGLAILLGAVSATWYREGR